MLSAVIQITLALDILLVCGEGVVPGTRRYLPLGRSHLAQLGLVLSLAVAGVEIWEAFVRLRGG